MPRNADVWHELPPIRKKEQRGAGWPRDGPHALTSPGNNIRALRPRKIQGRTGGRRHVVGTISRSRPTRGSPSQRATLIRRVSAYCVAYRGIAQTPVTSAALAPPGRLIRSHIWPVSPALTGGLWDAHAGLHRNAVVTAIPIAIVRFNRICMAEGPTCCPPVDPFRGLTPASQATIARDRYAIGDAAHMPALKFFCCKTFLLQV